MKNLPLKWFGRSLLAALASVPLFALAATAAPPLPSADDASDPKTIPDPLLPWVGWATWDDAHRLCPTPYGDPKTHLCFWPSRLGLQIDRAGGRFDLGVTVFHETWVPLPGGPDVWPQDVRAANGGGGAPIPVVEHDGVPSVRLPAGTHRLEGAYRWDEAPRGIPLPRQIGVLSLVVDGRPVEAPTWDAQGFLWLKRDGAAEPADKDFLAVKVYAALEDGIPLWLRSEIELTVSGKSREEDLGNVLPEGWKLSSIESPLPVAVDDAGRLKAQVRAGKWTVRANAFRAEDTREIRYAPGTRPAAAEQLVAFKSKPDFRMVEITGAPSIDVSQTTFPDKWRELPVYRWDTAAPFRLEERMRGMGQGKPAGLAIKRDLWLDEDGRGLTFRDRITGPMQQIWRLDAAPGQDLGSVRNAGQGQLVTRNPQNAAPGVEIRTRAVNLEATGRMPRTGALSATGWRSDADDLRVSLNLPPGWRLFALFGADYVRGDWLTAWTLLDLFLLLIFSLAVFRLWGVTAGVLAFCALGLSYHEPGAPRLTWIALLVPLALLRVVPEGRSRRVVGVAKWVCVTVFVLVLVPFLTQQVQQALYPQLERIGSGSMMGVSEGMFGGGGPPVIRNVPQSAPVLEPDEAPSVTLSQEFNPEERDQQAPARGSSSYGGVLRYKQAPSKNSNMFFDAKARIQTGPGVPEWTWRTVSFGWNGPVQASQQVRPWLIPLGVERFLTVLRIALLLGLAVLLLQARGWGDRFLRFIKPKTPPPTARATGAAAAVLLATLLGLAAPAARAQEIPDQATLDTLRQRLLKPSDAYPTAAEIPSVTLTLQERRLTIEADIHTAIRVAVPLPGRLPAWSPVSVLVDGKPEPALRREDGYLWVALPAGVHRVRVEGALADVTEWEWTFLLKPRRVAINAPGWTFNGVRPDGVPEAQVFFTRQQKAAAGAASYDRNDFQTILLLDRQLELGLVWQVRTTVSRLTPAGKAVSLRVPLLPGENVFSANAVAKDGFIDVRLGAQEESFTWESGLPVTERLQLATRAGDSWVERWNLVASPVWNVALAGLPPVFEPANAGLVPVWQPWPGESVDLTISRPEAIAGATVTVHRGTHEIALGSRQRVSKLNLALRCSLGEDFLVDLPAAAEVTSLLHQGKPIPVRRDGSKVIVPLRPGEQTVSLDWKINEPLNARAQAEPVRLPVESANVSTVLSVPANRWTLWASGPQRGPAVRFWGILACSALAAFALGRVPRSPLRSWEWTLLLIGLTQVWLPAALVVIGWLFFLAWRGDASFSGMRSAGAHNVLQWLLILITAFALGTLLVAVAEGLLGSPKMFITGNGSSRTVLRWFQARCEAVLPRPGVLTVSIWWYRGLMLAWALWLAASLLRWLRWGWENFSRGGIFRAAPPRAVVTPLPPPLPVQQP